VFFREDNQNCVEALTVAQYKWRVESCSKENHFVCERPEGKKHRGRCHIAVFDSGKLAHSSSKSEFEGSIPTRDLKRCAMRSHFAEFAVPRYDFNY
jgi:hypothetical protein